MTSENNDDQKKDDDDGDDVEDHLPKEKVTLHRRSNLFFRPEIFFFKNEKIFFKGLAEYNENVIAFLKVLLTYWIPNVPLP